MIETLFDVQVVFNQYMLSDLAIRGYSVVFIVACYCDREVK